MLRNSLMLAVDTAFESVFHSPNSGLDVDQFVDNLEEDDNDFWMTGSELEELCS